MADLTTPKPPPLPPPLRDALPADEPLRDALPAPPPLPKPRVAPPPLPPRHHLALRLLFALASGFEWLFGAAALMVGLAALAALPVVQFLSLGYLLEAGARVARSGRLRDGFIGVRTAARLGGLVAGTWLCFLPLRLVAGLAHSAQVIDPGGAVATRWRAATLVLLLVTAGHVACALARGGKLRYFFWPFNFIWVIRRLARGGYYAELRDGVWDTAMSLRVPYYFSLGARGFLAALAWLAVPVTLLAVGRGPGAVALVGFLGALLLGVVLLYLPFLQLRLAAANRLAAAFEWRAARAEYRRAPWAHAFAFVLTLLLALPLYLLKIEMVPREAAWLPGLVFVAFIFPARLLTGWALGRARRREQPRHWFFRWTGRAPLVPAAGLYVLVVYFAQFTSWNGVWSLYEQHAFLLPVPFFGM